MGAKPLQAAFSLGEISPEFYARTDTAAYHRALRTCQNWYIRRSGGVSNRPGTEFLAEVKDSDKKVRLIPFRFSRTVSYALEFGDGYIRFYRDGAQIESGGSPYEISSPFSDSELDDLDFAQSADVMTLVHPDHEPVDLRRNGDTDWEITSTSVDGGPFKELNTDNGATVWASSSTGSTTIKANKDIFTADMVDSLFYLEAKNLGDIKPWEANRRLEGTGSSVFGLIRRNSVGDVYRCVTDDTATNVEIRTGMVEPTHKEGVRSDGAGTPITDGSTELADAAGVQWEFLYSFYGIIRITGFTSATEVSATVLGRLPDAVVSTSTSTQVGTFSGDNSTETFSLTGNTSTDSEDYEVEVQTTIESNEPGVDDYIFTSIMSPDKYSVTTSPNEITFDDAPASNQFITVTEFVGRNKTSIWAHGAWSDDAGYPSSVTYFGDRRVFSGTADQPQTFWMSAAGDYPNFLRPFPLTPDSPINGTLNARQINPINHMMPMGHLVFFSDGDTWRMTTGESEIVSPSTIGVRPQTSEGTKKLRPEMVGNRAVFVEKQGSRLHDFVYSREAQGYGGQDLTFWSNHLVDESEITQIAYHRSPYEMLWAIRDDGVLLSLTYIPEREVMGWSRHTTTDGEFESICVVPESDQDYAYVVVKRDVNGVKRYVERITQRNDTDIDKAWFVDSGFQYDGENTDAADTMELTGSGWTVDDFLTLTAAGHSPFAAGGLENVGDEVVLESGDDSVRVAITAWTSSTEVTVKPQDQDVPASLQASATSNWTFRKTRMTGLVHLRGKVVTVLADGAVQSEKTVKAGFGGVGQIDLDVPAGKVLIGLPIEADIETLSVSFGGGESTADRKKIIPKVSAYVKNTRGLSYGRSANSELYEVKPREEDDDYDVVPTKTEIQEVSIDAMWDNDGRVLIRQSYPLPATVTGIIPDVQMGGSSA